MCNRSQNQKLRGSSPHSVTRATDMRNDEHRTNCRARRRVLSTTRNAASLFVAAGSAVIIQRFCPLPECIQRSSLEKSNEIHWPRHEENLIRSPKTTKKRGWENIWRTCATNIQIFHLPRFIDDPPPLILLVACLSFAFAITAFRHSHRVDRHQDHIIGLALLGGLLVAATSEEFLLSLKTLLPWSFIVGLVLSTLAHRLLELGSREHANEWIYVDDEKVHREGTLAKKG